MKMKSSADSIRENNGLHVCQKSSKISKNSLSHARNFQHEAELDTCTSNNQEIRSDETNCCEMVDEETLHVQTSTIETIFSPILESIDIEPNINVSDFFISDMIVSSSRNERNSAYSTISEATCLLDYERDELSRFSFDEYMLLPFLEDSIESNSQNEDISEESSIYVAIHQLKPCDLESDLNSFPEWDPSECLNPQMFIRNFLDFSEMPQELKEPKSITLVLDLDETLVHSSLEHCDDADFSFQVFSSLKEQTVYVKQRPYLRAFLEKVAEMFHVVIFTASQSIYAKQLLDILDPNGNIISRRAYRESCILTDGSYTKDLTVLGVDLAKIAIIDNSPQVFRLQVNNGIPIKSWFDDPTDCALITLLPFLETLVDAEDVRPIIAKRFGNKE
ncbi:hypothetical protein L2E82_14176 [Cichorium intybus]|uniref:Uncharacterized protein n=1 Tax=Cichorium intybus TaxID=13427 RepID=A0ACB9EZV5_CICIN|nr:hypothetical protein L2E82_14176 [Cichorium intybus]